MSAVKNWALIIYLGLAGPAAAWGVEGHEVIADIAEQRLSRPARHAVEELLALEGAHDLAQIANWADTVNLPFGNGPRHTTRLPLDDGPVSFSAVCVKQHPCATWGIEQQTAILADRSRPARERLIALKYVVHLVGDIHQPLHATIANGDNVQVHEGSALWSLHKVWDTIIIRRMKRPSKQLADDLLRRRRSRDLNVSGTPEDWTIESRNIARDYIFPHLHRFKSLEDGSFDMPESYLAESRPIVLDRLTQAGLRLAALLNKSLSDP